MAEEATKTDLPDPAQAAGAAKAGGTDELLAQLAGDEIDRLLAEADKHAAAGGSAVEVDPSAVAAEVAGPEVPDPSEAEVVAAAAEVAAAETTEVAAAVAEPAPAKPKRRNAADGSRAAGEALHPDDPLAGQLDSLFEELSKQPDPLAEAAPAGQAAPPPQPAPAAETDPAPTAVAEGAGSEFDDATSATERDRLVAGLDQETTDPVAAAEAAAEITAAIDGAVRQAARPGRELPAFVLKPLVWMNAPFAFLPDTLRDILGKVGLVTFVNAVALLAYLRFFRKH